MYLINNNISGNIKNNVGTMKYISHPNNPMMIVMYLKLVLTLLKSMPRSDIESIAERLNFAKTYKYNKDKLIHNLISSYKERVLEKIYL